MYHIFFIHSSRTSRLLPRLRYCKQCCSEHWGTVSFSVMVFSGCMPSTGIAGSYGSFIPTFFKESPYNLPLWLCQFTFPPTVQEGSLFSARSPAFSVCRLLGTRALRMWIQYAWLLSFDSKKLCLAAALQMSSHHKEVTSRKSDGQWWS